MHVTVVTRPEPLLSIEEVRAHLKVEDNADDTLIEAYMLAAQGHIDGPGGWLGRALGMQTLEARLDNFDCGSIRLLYPEVVEIVSVKHIDANGVEQTIAPDRYEMCGRSLVPVFGANWPAHRWQREAVRIRYRAGYPTEAPQIAVAKAAILLMIGDLYRNRHTTRDGTGVGSIPMSTTVENLLGPLVAY